jgi:hypothetical protein
MLLEDVQDAGFGQDIGEREPLVPREAGADRLQAGHAMAFSVRVCGLFTWAGVVRAGRGD